LFQTIFILILNNQTKHTIDLELNALALIDTYYASTFHLHDDTRITTVDRVSLIDVHAVWVWVLNMLTQI